MGILDELLERGEEFGATAERLGAAAVVKGLWLLANRAEADGDLEQRVDLLFQIASSSRPYIPSSADARWRPERDVVAALGEVYAVCSSTKESVAYLPRTQAALAGLVDAAEALQGAHDAEHQWADLLDEGQARWAHLLFEHALMSHSSTPLTPEVRRLFVELKHVLFQRMQTRS